MLKSDILCRRDSNPPVLGLRAGMKPGCVYGIPYNLPGIPNSCALHDSG